MLGQRDLAGRQGRRHAVVAVDAGDLFDEVFLDGDVEAPRRWCDTPAGSARPRIAVRASARINVDHIDVHAKRAEDPRHFRVVDTLAQHAGQPFATQHNRRAQRQIGFAHGFDDRPGAAAQNVQHELRRVFQRHARQFRIDTALEAMRGVGVQPELARATDDCGRCEVRRFEEHAGGRVGHAGVEAAHHAGQRDGPVGVGDDEEAGVDRRLAFVEQFQRFTGAAVAHADRACKPVGVEGVHRLAEFQHHQVGDVDQRADRAQAAALQFLGEPRWRGGIRVQAFDHAAAVARRIGTGVEFDRQRGGGRRGDRRGLERTHLRAQRGSDVEGDATDREAVGAVRRELQLDARIRQAEVGAQCGAHGCVGRQFQQARSVRVDIQFLRRAQHAEALDTAKLRGLDGEATRQRGTDRRQRGFETRTGVRRTTDDLHMLTAAYGHLADLQAISLGMTHRFDDLGDDDAGQFTADRLDAFHFQANRRERRAQRVAVGVDSHMLAQPAFVELHANCPRKRTSLSKKLRRSLTP